MDTPGVLSGEKQRTQRSYDFTGVISWFAAKCDLILLLFDPHKLDISDEFKRVISSLRGHDDKIRVVLNKADQVDTQQVRRILNSLWDIFILINVLNPTVSTIAYEGLWSTNVVSWQSAKYSWGYSCIYWVCALSLMVHSFWLAYMTFQGRSIISGDELCSKY